MVCEKAAGAPVKILRKKLQEVLLKQNKKKGYLKENQVLRAERSSDTKVWCLNRK